MGKSEWHHHMIDKKGLSISVPTTIWWGLPPTWMLNSKRHSISLSIGKLLGFVWVCEFFV
jgi:hypothetical protein